MKRISRWLALLLIAATAFMMFSPWIRLEDDFGVVEELKEGIDDINDYLDDLPYYYEDALDEILDESNVNYSVKKFKKTVRDAIGIIKDDELSPSELALKLDGIVDLSRKINHVLNEDVDGNNIVLYDLEDLAEILDDLILYIIVFKAVFIGTLVLLGLFAVCDLFDKKVLTGICGCLSVLVMLVWLGALIVAFIVIKDEVGDVLKLMPAPFIAVVAIIVAYVFALMAKPYSGLPKVPKIAKPAKISAPVTKSGSAPKAFCTECGAKIIDNAAFCASCGQKL